MSSVSQIRINKTPEISEILTFLKQKYYGLSENEIIKMVLSQFYAMNHQSIELHEIDYSHLSPSAQKKFNSIKNTSISQLNNI